MQTYVFLTRFTQQGIEKVRDSPARTGEAREVVESLGGAWESFYVTMGRYDGVVVAEFPDDVAAARDALALGSGGNVTTEALRAFTLEEFGDVVAGVS